MVIPNYMYILASKSAFLQLELKKRPLGIIELGNWLYLQRLRMEMEEITAQQYLHEKTMKVHRGFLLVIEPQVVRRTNTNAV